MINLELASWTQHATAYRPNGRAVATVSRRRVLTRRGPVWTAHDLDGDQIAGADSAVEIWVAVDRFASRVS